MALTDTACKNAKPKDKPYKMADNEGLYLSISPNGAKHWRMKYRFLKKEKLLSFGPYPLISLVEAREKRTEAKKMLAEGVDPSIAKKEKTREMVRNAENTFKVITIEWHENQKERWSKGHAENVLHRLERDIFPYIGILPISGITPPELLDVLRKIEKRGALDIVKRTRQICSQIFRYGIQTGRCTQNPAEQLKGNGVLRTRKTQHFAALDIKEIPEFLRALERNDARLYVRTRRAIYLSMLTFVRPGEIRQAKWEEIDFEEAEWTIPGERMKMGRDHIVPLSQQALTILEEQKEETGRLNTEWVFPSQVSPRKPMSDGTVLVAIKKLGFGGRMTAHGFRALARTTIREKLNYQPDVIEQQLAHKASGPLGEAYDRARFLDIRKKMMQHWADYLDGIVTHGKVVKADFGKKRA
ncbi:MAG: integrase arm-type DNA-binding domain-containing protein [Rickettsiales bacterium]|nr:integrase arm-type DNA-binding domain-containing protein [Rickettsiales bacterium]